MASPRPISGYFEVNTPNQGLLALRAAGLNPSLSGDTLLIGCSGNPADPNMPTGSPLSPMPQNAPQTALGGPFPQNGGPLPGQPQNAPYGAPTAPQTPIPNPDEDIGSTSLRTRYVTGKKLTDLLKGLPGVSILAEPDTPGPVTIYGPRKWVMEAQSFAKRLDVCPMQFDVTSVIVARSGSDLANRAFGVRVDISNGNLVFGGVPLRDTGISLNVGPLTATIDALRQHNRLEEVYVTSSHVLFGSDLTITDGQEVPVETGDLVTEVGTTTTKRYRTVGHSLKVRVTAADGPFITGTIDHELSSQQGSNSVGPTFGSRRVQTAFRVQLGEPIVMAVSGADSASTAKSKGFLFTSKATSRIENGGFVVLIITPSGCAHSADDGGAAGAARREDLQYGNTANLAQK